MESQFLFARQNDNLLVIYVSCTLELRTDQKSNVLRPITGGGQANKIVVFEREDRGFESSTVGRLPHLEAVYCPSHLPENHLHCFFINKRKQKIKDSSLCLPFRGRHNPLFFWVLSLRRTHAQKPVEENVESRSHFELDGNLSKRYCGCRIVGFTYFDRWMVCLQIHFSANNYPLVGQV